MRKFLYPLLTLLVFIAMVGLAACAPTTPAQPTAPSPTATQPPAPKVIELKVATTTPPTAPPGATIKEWTEKVEQMSGGKVKFTVYYASSLFEAKDILRSVQAGVADISDFWAAAVPGSAPLTQISYLPFIGWKDGPTGTKAWREVLYSTPELLKEHGGLKVLYPVVAAESTGYVHTTKKLIKTLADFKGVKLIGAEYAAKWMSAVGATPVFTPFEDTYTSLERGITEGHTGTFGWMMGSGTLMITPYHTIIGTQFTVIQQPLVVNPSTWDKLPADIKKIIEDLDEWYTNTRIGKEAGAEIAGLKATKEAGQTYYQLPPDEMQKWMAAAKPLHEEWIKDMESKGLPGRKVYDALQKAIEKYSK